MNCEITIQEVQFKFIQLDNQQMLLCSDVAQLYQVEAKRINEAVKNTQYRNIRVDELSWKGHADLAELDFMLSQNAYMV